MQNYYTMHLLCNNNGGKAACTRSDAIARRRRSLPDIPLEHVSLSSLSSALHPENKSAEWTSQIPVSSKERRNSLEPTRETENIPLRMSRSVSVPDIGVINSISSNRRPSIFEMLSQLFPRSLTSSSMNSSNENDYGEERRSGHVMDDAGSSTDDDDADDSNMVIDDSIQFLCEFIIFTTQINFMEMWDTDGYKVRTTITHNKTVILYLSYYHQHHFNHHHLPCSWTPETLILTSSHCATLISTTSTGTICKSCSGLGRCTMTFSNTSL